mgnify:CR=1 FL=1
MTVVTGICRESSLDTITNSFQKSGPTRLNFDIHIPQAILWIYQWCSLLVTVDDLSSGQSLPEPIVVEVTDINWQAGQSRRAVIELVDTAGNPLRLIDYEGAEISIDWKQNHQYRISRCGVQIGGRGFEIDLAPSKKHNL